MGDDVANRWSVLRLVLEQQGHERFELRVEKVFFVELRVLLPEIGRPAVVKVLVEVVPTACLFERRMAGVKREENHP